MITGKPTSSTGNSKEGSCAVVGVGPSNIISVTNSDTYVRHKSDTVFILTVAK
jgi:hypothetical protein